MIGGDDVFFGGSGEDRLYGGGGADTIWGGADSDWLEGQNGKDALYGGSGIDMLLLDTNTQYATIPSGQFETFDGHRGNNFASDVADDNATDILLIEGTKFNDSITVGQVVFANPQTSRSETRMSIRIGDRTLTANWRDFSDLSDANGKPLVEQIRISGLMGDDELGFVSETVGAVQPLDVADLITRSDDFVVFWMAARATIPFRGHKLATESMVDLGTIASTVLQATTSFGGTAGQEWAKPTTLTESTAVRETTISWVVKEETNSMPGRESQSWEVNSASLSTTRIDCSTIAGTPMAMAYSMQIQQSQLDGWKIQGSIGC